MAAGGVSHLWSEWGIQIIVLLSFALQVLLLVFGGMRRRGLSTWQKVALWLAYLSADSTAIYALGHLSITSGSREHQLVAFWAPFLLLHLGGPHNVTAYALEDNRLWLRHLQTLVVQVLGAAYVLYKFMPDSGTLLLLASISMFVAGIVKYGERTWALKCANDNKSSSGKVVNTCELLRQDMGDDDILLRAHSQFAICKSGFDDTKVSMRASRRDPASPDLSPFYDEDIFKLVEMELSLMYDTLYTKAAVIHTWYGFCIHSISLVGTSAALCLFWLSLSLSRGDHAYSRADVAISYILLAGALVLEAISACRAVLSSWTCYLLVRKAEGSTRAAWLQWLHYYVLSSLRKALKPANRRMWRGTIGQYNMLHLCTRDRTGLGSKLAAKIGKEDWWNKLHFSGTFRGTDSLSMQQLKGLLFKMIRRDGFATLPGPLTTMTTRGSFILGKKQVYKGVAKWTVLNIELDESIVVWHIATDLFIWESKAGHEVELIEATRVLSNYMMFLLVAKPNMLPGRERRTLHTKVSGILEKIWRGVHVLGDEHKSVSASPGSWNKWCVLKELFHHEGPNDSTITRAQREELAERVCANWSYEQAQRLDSYPEVLEGSRDELYTCAASLAKQLLLLDRPDTLEIIFSVWVEMMLYAADHCPRDSHARELSNGGEFITILWLLVQHWTYVYKNKIAC